MKLPLNDFQRGYAQQRITFSSNVLSLELAESLRRTSLACAENQKKQAGNIDVICGLYLQDGNEIARHFRGDFAAVVSENFPVHRLGRGHPALSQERVRTSNLGRCVDRRDVWVGLKPPVRLRTYELAVVVNAEQAKNEKGERQKLF